MPRTPPTTPPKVEDDRVVLDYMNGWNEEALMDVRPDFCWCCPWCYGSVCCPAENGICPDLGCELA